MAQDQALSVLAENELFTGLDHTALVAMRDAATVKHFTTDDCIVRQGDPAVYFAVVVSGRAKLVQCTPDGHQILVRFIGPGQEFGILAILEGSVYPLSIQAVEPCALLAWTGPVLAECMTRYPRVALNGLRIMVIRNQETQRRYQELLTKRVEQRVAQAVLHFVKHAGRPGVNGGIDIDLPVSREDLAEYAGTTLYTASRVLSQWERNGVVECGREQLLVRHLDAITHLADMPESNQVGLPCGPCLPQR